MPTATQETMFRSAFREAYSVSPKALGVRNSDTDARGIIVRTGLPSSEVIAVRSTFLKGVDSHLYETVPVHMRSFIASGDSVSIWTVGETQGIPELRAPGFDVQHRKIVQSGIRRMAFGQEFRTSLPRESKERFKVWATDFDKEQMLSDILRDFESRCVDHVLLADDKSDNLLAARAEVIKAKAAGIFSGTVDIVWMNQGRSKDKLPAHYEGTLEDFQSEFITVGSFDDYAAIVSERRARYGGGSLGHILDWDHTLADETARKKEIENTLVDRYAGDPRIGTTTYLPPEDPRFSAICELLDVQPSRALIEPLGGGISFVGVYRVNWDGVDAVVKHENNPERVWRLTEEVEGYHLLDVKDGYIRKHMPKVFNMTDHPVLGSTIVMEYFRGPNLRQAILGGMLTENEIHDAAHQVLTVVRDFWANQDHVRDHEQWFSMPMAEWEETKKLFGAIAEEIALTVGKSPQELMNMNLRVKINGQEHLLPSLGNLLRETDDFMHERPDVVLSLGYNDLSYGNVVVSRTNDNAVDIKIVDPQWVRPLSDPAADITRSIKAVSSTTATITEGFVTIEDDTLVCASVAEVSSVLVDIENQGMARLAEFVGVIGDETLPLRVRQHMVASQLREIALIAKKRGTLAQLGFNLSRIAAYRTSQYQYE